MPRLPRMGSFLPIQLLPEGIYPVSQEQKKVPGRLLQVCTQPPLSRLHSSISVVENNHRVRKICHMHTHSGKSATIRESIHDSGVCKVHYT